jgi:hypothetical protein
MTRHDRWIFLILVAALLPVAACKQSTATAADEEPSPARVEHLKGDEPTRVTLTEEAARRLDIQTAAIRDLTIDGRTHRVIPYAAVLYDTEGNTWTYYSPAPLVFVRHRITVDRIEGELAVLTEGPTSGTRVVTVGAQELYGSELEFEEE